MSKFGNLQDGILKMSIRNNGFLRAEWLSDKKPKYKMLYLKYWYIVIANVAETIF